MMKLIVTLLIGMIFGLGIAISGMANPAKVLDFFDLAGTWDPSLIFVMGGALITTAIGYQIVFRTRTSPLMDIAYMVPSSKDIDTRLVVGSATFGVGWGIAGFCPGGAIPAIGLGYSETLMFMFALIAGIFIARLLNTKITAQTA
ncbi:MAG: DUF6691 family protein [Lentilitoribacter sp.]